MKFQLLLPVVFSVLILCASAKPPEPLANLDETLQAAAAQNKLAFIMVGRETCGNCTATKSMISAGNIFIPDSHFVMADLSCDNAKVYGEFLKKFNAVKFGNTLPLVVVTDSQGAVLASSSGYKEAAEWNNLLSAAKAKARKAASSAATSPAKSWPFSSPPAAKPQP